MLHNWSILKHWRDGLYWVSLALLWLGVIVNFLLGYFSRRMWLKHMRVSLEQGELIVINAASPEIKERFERLKILTHTTTDPHTVTVLSCIQMTEFICEQLAAEAKFKIIQPDGAEAFIQFFAEEGDDDDEDDEPDDDEDDS